MIKPSTLTPCALALVCTVGRPGWREEARGSVPRRLEVGRQDGGHLAYYHWPAEGPSLLLIPGSWSDYRQFDAVGRHLTEDLNLVIVELPGHGRSWPPALTGTIEGFAQEVLHVTDALGWKSWYAGGHSIGGMIAIELARQRPQELVGVISLEGWTHHEVLSEAFSGQIYNTLSKEQEEQRLQARSQTLSRLSENQISAFRLIWQLWDGLPILQSTSVPVLEVWGDRNQSRPSPQQMRIPDRDNIWLRWVVGASHSLPLERPKEVAAAINQFIGSQDAPLHRPEERNTSGPP